MGLVKQAKKKVSIDFSALSYQLLSEYTEEKGLSNSAVINFLVENILAMDDAEKKKFGDFCFKLLNEEKGACASVFSDFEVQAYHRKIERYSNLVDFFAVKEKLDVAENMHRINMENGYIVYPKDWVVTDYKNPNECKYAGVVSIRNQKEYGIPIFLFFSEKKINLLSAEDQKEILKSCESKHKEFETIQKRQIMPSYNSKGELLNGDLWAKAPIIGIFPIGVYGEETVYPYGAMILRE